MRFDRGAEDGWVNEACELSFEVSSRVWIKITFLIAFLVGQKQNPSYFLGSVYSRVAF